MVAHSNYQLIFEVIRHKRGGFSADCLNANISTKAANLVELHDNITAAVDNHFPGGTAPDPGSIHLLLFAD
jgi:hypothetical protein